MWKSPQYLELEKIKGFIYEKELYLYLCNDWIPNNLSVKIGFLRKWHGYWNHWDYHHHCLYISLSDFGPSVQFDTNPLCSSKCLSVLVNTSRQDPLVFVFFIHKNLVYKASRFKYFHSRNLEPCNSFHLKNLLATIESDHLSIGSKASSENMGVKRNSKKLFL